MEALIATANGLIKEATWKANAYKYTDMTFALITIVLSSLIAITADQRTLNVVSGALIATLNSISKGFNLSKRATDLKIVAVSLEEVRQELIGPPVTPERLKELELKVNNLNFKLFTNNQTATI